MEDRFDLAYQYSHLFTGTDEALARAHMESTVPPEYWDQVAIEFLSMNGREYTQWVYKPPNEPRMAWR